LLLEALLRPTVIPGLERLMPNFGRIGPTRKLGCRG